MTNSPSLESAVRSIKWARKDADDLKTVISGYFAGNGYGEIREKNSQTGEQTIKIAQIKPFPDDAEKLLNGVISQLRASLDYMTFGLVQRFNPSFDGNVNFPWGSTPADTQSRIARLGIPSDFLPIFLATEPYKRGDSHVGGDELFRTLNNAGNQTKHHFTLSVNLNVTTVKTNIFIGDGNISKPCSWNAQKQELILFRFSEGAQFTYDIEAPFDVLFANPQIIRGLRIHDTLDYFIGKVSTLADEIIRKFDELTG